MRTKLDYQTGSKTPNYLRHGLFRHPKVINGTPYQSAQISVSLVSFAVEIYPAVTSARPFQFHQIDRTTGERIHYQNVAADGDEEYDTGAERKRGSLHIAAKGHGGADHDEDKHVVEKSDIVKGYEYEKGKYAIIEPDDLKRLRIPGKDTLEIAQFTPASELIPSLYVKPYFRGPQERSTSDGLRCGASGDGGYRHGWRG